MKRDDASVTDPLHDMADGTRERRSDPASNFLHTSWCCFVEHIGLLKAERVLNRLLTSFCSVYRGAIYCTVGFASCMDLREVFAANLRRLRNAKGVSQDELAYEANVSRSYLSQLEKGTFYASLNVVGRLSEALGVEPAELLKIPQKRISRVR
jgi:DNA-binding XRE family transcriptional regulator